MVPGSPPLPEYIKASVYLPPSLVNNHPELHPSILRITQEFLETIGITTVRNWRARAINDMGYSLSMPGNPQPNGKIYGVPKPKPRSSHYIIPGQPMGSSHAVNNGHNPTSVSVSTPSPASSSYGFNNEMDTMTQLFDAQEQIHLLCEQLSSANGQIKKLEAQLGLFSGLADVSVSSPSGYSHFPTSMQNSPVKPSVSATSPFRHHALLPEPFQSPSKSHPRTPRKGRVADVGLGSSHSSTPSRSTHFTASTSAAPFKGKGKLHKEKEIAATSFTFTALTLESHDLTSRLDRVLLVVKLFPAGNRWNELLHVGIPHEVITEIMTAIEIDEGHLE